jgi:hypothetical protein
MPELRQNFVTKEWVIIATGTNWDPECLSIPSGPKLLLSICGT